MIGRGRHRWPLRAAALALLLTACGTRVGGDPAGGQAGIGPEHLGVPITESAHPSPELDAKQSVPELASRSKGATAATNLTRDATPSATSPLPSGPRAAGDSTPQAVGTISQSNTPGRTGPQAKLPPPTSSGLPIVLGQIGTFSGPIGNAVQGPSPPSRPGPVRSTTGGAIAGHP
jgi:hypothetical protein